jgi:hypothetical protein
MDHSSVGGRRTIEPGQKIEMESLQVAAEVTLREVTRESVVSVLRLRVARELLVEHVRTRPGAAAISLSCVPAKGTSRKHLSDGAAGGRDIADVQPRRR